jgi:hypothetical protein
MKQFDFGEPWIIGCAIFAVLMYYVIIVLLLARIFRKAKKSAWLAWVPLVNVWVWFQIGGYRGTNLLWLLGAGAVYSVIFCPVDALVKTVAVAISLALTLVYLFFYLINTISIQEKLGKPPVFFILLFINLIAPLWLWILALDGSKYNAKKGHQLK